MPIRAALATAMLTLVYVIPAQPATSATWTAVPPSASQTDTAGQTFRSVRFADRAGVSSTYHLTHPAGARGLLVYLDGTDQYAVDHPDGDILGGPDGLEALAAARGLAVLTPRAPDGRQWHTDLDRSGSWVADLMPAVAAYLGVSEIWLVGYSSGAQLITKRLLPAHPDLCTGGAFIIGGGGAPSGQLDSNPSCPVWWITGDADRGQDATDPYDALTDARAGARAYASTGATAIISTPPGVDHEDIRSRLPSITASGIDQLRPALSE